MLLAEHFDTEVSRSRSTNQGFIRNLRSNHLCPVPRSPAPCPTDHRRTYLQCLNARDRSVLCRRALQCERHTSQECVTMYSPFVPPQFIRMYSPQDSSRCTHRLLPYSAQNEVACRQQHLHSGSCQVLRGKTSGVGFSAMLAKSHCFLRDFVLHPEPLDFKVLQSSTTLAALASDKTTASPESFQNGLAVQALCAEPFVIA